MSSELEPKLVEIKEVKLHNPQEDEDKRIQKVDIEGNDLGNADYIDELHEEGYITRGFTARVVFDGELFDIAFSGSDMMGYAKVEDIGNYQKGQQLMDDIRERYMTNFREI